MINAATTLLFIMLLFASGKLLEGIKHLLKFFATYSLKLLNRIGFNIEITESKIKTSKLFKETFQEIKKVKKSKNNNKIKPSISIGALIIFLCSLSLIIINLEAVSGSNIVTNWLFEIMPIQLIASAEDMNVMFTAVMFSMVSFSISKLLQQWKAAAPYRKAKRDMRLKKYVIDNVSTKELLDSVKERDLLKYNNMKGNIDINDRDQK